MFKATHIGEAPDCSSHRLEWNENTLQVRAQYYNGDVVHVFGSYKIDQLTICGWVMKKVKPPVLENK